TEIYTLSLHDALPISRRQDVRRANLPEGAQHGQNLPLIIRLRKLLHFRQIPKVIVLEPSGNLHDPVKIDHSFGAPFRIPSPQRVGIVDASVKLSLKQCSIELWS